MKSTLNLLLFQLHAYAWTWAIRFKWGRMRELSIVLKAVRVMEGIHKLPRINMEIHPNAFKKAFADLRREGWIDRYGVTANGKKILIDELKEMAVEAVRRTPKFDTMNVTEKVDAFHATRVYVTNLTTLEALLADMMYFHVVETHLPEFVSAYVDNVTLPRRSKDGTKTVPPPVGSRPE